MKLFSRLLISLLVLALIVAAYFWIKYSRNNIETKIMNDAARTSAGGEFIKLSAGITHYQEGGTDSGKTVILVHGFSVPYYIWDGCYDSLVQNGFRVIRYDDFGRGFSDRPEESYDPQFYRQQLSELIDSLHLKKPVCLAGVSFGGAIVTDFAVNNSQLVDRVVLVDPVYLFKNNKVSELITNYKMALDHESQATGQLTDFKYPDHFPGWVDKYKVQMEYKGFRHALISTRKDYSGDSIISNYQKLGGLNKKVLLIWGREDQTVPFQYSDSIRQKVPVDFFPVDDARHLPVLEKPSLVIPKIISFLKE